MKKFIYALLLIGLMVLSPAKVNAELIPQPVKDVLPTLPIVNPPESTTAPISTPVDTTAISPTSPVNTPVATDTPKTDTPQAQTTQTPTITPQTLKPVQTTTQSPLKTQSIAVLSPPKPTSDSRYLGSATAQGSLVSYKDTKLSKSTMQRLYVFAIAAFITGILLISFAGIKIKKHSKTMGL